MTLQNPKSARASMFSLPAGYAEKCWSQVAPFVNAVQQATDLILPPECVWCQNAIAPQERLCSQCRSVFNREYYHCLRCATPLPAVIDNQSCLRCRESGWRFKRIVALGPYRGRLREAVIAMKKPIFESLTCAVGELLGQPRAIGARFQLPSSASRSGSELLAATAGPSYVRSRYARGKSRGAVGVRFIIAIGITNAEYSQTRDACMEQSPGQRAGAFRIRHGKRISGREILVVDDVVTSGATAAELTRCLLKAGADRVIIAAAARGTGTRDTGSKSNGSAHDKTEVASFNDSSDKNSEQSEVSG
ncbi:MAG: double zinc ribbon domain-containing protein [Pirellulales bacterium]